MRQRLGITVALTLACVACGGGSPGSPASPLTPPVTPPVTPKSLLQPRPFAADCGDFLAYLAESLTNQYLQVYQCYTDQACPVAPPAPEPAIDGGSGSSSGASSSSGSSGAASPGTGGDAGSGSGGPTRVSETNNQEAGVDEADIVKVDPTDGRIYILTGQGLSVVPAFPAAGMAARPLARLELATAGEGFYARDMYLDTAGRRLVALGDAYGSDGQSRATAVLVSIADPAAPTVLARLDVEGTMLDSRRVAARVHRVLSWSPALPDWFHQDGDPLVSQRRRYLDAKAAGRSAEAESLRAAIAGEIASRTRSAGAERWLPERRRIGADGAVQSGRMACSDFSAASTSTALGFAVVDSFGSDGGNRALAGLVNNGQQIYASADNLYLLQPSSGWFFAPNQTEETAIYRLALSPTAAARFAALGKVSGSVLNSYSLSEHEGRLRVASTEGAFSPGRNQSSSRLSVLDATTVGDMPEVGALAGLAPGERIQGARLIGDRGYVVTFRQIDPLFGIDLSDPTRPQLRSELKLPGFSSHLQPLGDDWLLTVGRSGTEEGLDGQVGIQLFSVADLASIRAVGALSPAAGGSGYSYSVAEYDPHAFTYFADSETAATPGSLVLPLQSWGETEAERFTGFLVVRVDPAANPPLRELGRINHDDFPAAREESCGAAGGGSSSGSTGGSSGSSGGSADTPAPCRDYYLQYAEPSRALFQQDGAGTVLYTISSVGIVASEAAAPGREISRKELPNDTPCCDAMPVDSGDGTGSSGG